MTLRLYKEGKVNKEVKLTRRQFMRLSALSATSATLAACSGLDTLPHTQTITTIDDLKQSGFRFVKGKDDLKAELHELDSNNTQRLGRQMDAINRALPAINAIAQATGPAINGEALGQAFRKYAGNKQRVCLFNIIVALEWRPSATYLQTLKDAFTLASSLLFDVTDGYMAIGEVTIGGPELMECADIQIFASNRLSPRSSVNGLNNAEKYQPIRIGRGLWHKINRKNPHERATFPWSHQKGYATLVHEWGHYALGLKDQYLAFDPTAKLVMPTRQLIADTMMARLDSSELLDDDSLANQHDLSKLVKDGKLALLSPRPNPQANDTTSEWEALREHPRFNWLQIDDPHHSQQAPPLEKVNPAFAVIGTANDPYPAQELLFSLDGAGAGRQMIDSDCWVYVVKGPVTEPEGLIAQGSFETVGGFQLLGAQIGDGVVLIGNRQGTPSQPLVLWAQIVDDAGGTAQMGPWQAATPDQFPRIDVTPVGERNQGAAPPYRIKLAGFSSEDWQAITFPLGEREKRVGAKVDGLTVLDGHVLLVSTHTNQPQLVIAGYSLGGSAFSGYPAHPNPIPAGSADGNAMLFFYNEAERELHYPSNRLPSGRTFDGSKVVVTTNLQDTEPLPANCVPRSYTFSVTSNTTFWDLVDLHPTLILYYDQESRQDVEGDMVIARYDAQSQPPWVLLEQTIDKRDDYMAVVALGDDKTEPGLFKNPTQPDHFRLFLKMRNDPVQ